MALIHSILSLVLSVVPVRFRAKLWLSLMRVGYRRWGGESAAQRIPGGLYVKCSPLIRLSEGQALQFVGAHTSLPVPIVIDNFTHGDLTFLVMSRLPGHSLATVYRAITPEVEQLLSAQISRILAPLRAIAPPLTGVCGFGGGPVYCERLRFGSNPAGPWASTAAFHREVMLRTGGLREIPKDVDSEMVHSVVREAHAREHRICLTHNDLGPHNVLVDDDWNITGIVDWEACAWMPEYWECTKATFLPQYRKGCWLRIMSTAFPTYALEQQAERYIVSYRRGYA